MVLGTLYLHLLHQVGKHDNGGTVVVPDEPPKVSHGVGEGTLRGDVLVLVVVTLEGGAKSTDSLCSLGLCIAMYFYPARMRRG